MPTHINTSGHFGVVIDSKLKSAIYINRFSVRCFYHPRQTRAIWRSFNTAAMKTVNASITSLVVFCNIAFNMAPMQFIVVKFSPFSTPPHAPLLRRLQQQIEMNGIGYRCNNDLITNFTTSSTSAFIWVHHCTVHIIFVCISVGAVEGRRHLRSATRGNLVVSCTTNKTYGPRNFAVPGQSIWKSTHSLQLAAADLELT